MRRYQYDGIEKTFSEEVFHDDKTVVAFLNVVGGLGWRVVQYATTTAPATKIDGEKVGGTVLLQLLLVCERPKTLADWSPIAAWFVGLFHRIGRKQ